LHADMPRPGAEFYALLLFSAVRLKIE